MKEPALITVGADFTVISAAHRASRFSIRTVAFGARAAEEFGYSRVGPAPALGEFLKLISNKS